MLARIARYGSEERFAAGAPIYSRGDRNVDFFVVVEGSIEVFDVDDYDLPRVFLVLRSRQFSGELNLFNEREVLVSARAGEASRLLRVRRADFRRLVSIEADIGEIVMRAFILRRVSLIRHVHGGVVVVGPAHTADTLRLIQFLSRNAYPHRLVDTEHDAGGDGFLDCLSLGAADLPVVIAPGHRVLRKPSLAQLADDLGLTETFDHAQVFDLAVVGAGPAGLAAAVYGASEGLQTIVDREHGARRPGRHELEDRELPRLSDRHLGPGARRPGPGAGAEVRRAPRAVARRRRPRLRARAVHAQARGRRVDPRPRDRHRHRRALPQARRRRLRALRRRRHLLRGDGDGGRPLRRAGDRRRRRRQLGRPGRRLPRPQREARAHAVSCQGPRGDDVGLPGAADRALGPDQPASAFGGERARRRRLAAERHLDEPGERRTRRRARRAASS